MLFLFVHTAGTGGTKLDVKRKTRKQVVRGQVFFNDTKSYRSGAEICSKSIGVGQTVAGMTAAVVTD